jgi:hypothetical protein
VPGLAVLFDLTQEEARRRFIDGVAEGPKEDRLGRVSRPIGEGFA